MIKYLIENLSHKPLHTNEYGDKQDPLNKKGVGPQIQKFEKRNELDKHLQNYVDLERKRTLKQTESSKR